jgi:hypothetical protein
MDAEHALALSSAASTPTTRSHQFLILLALISTLAASASARAVDGCQVLLCFAAPNWRAIPQCVPPITQVLHDLARGKPFPSCGMSGAGNSATHAWSEAPTFCPPQYTHAFATESGMSYYCDFVGAVSVTVNGQLFARTWWTMDGGSSTDFSPYAKAQFGSWDSRFDDDYAAWLQARPPVALIDADY